MRDHGALFLWVSLFCVLPVPVIDSNPVMLFPRFPLFLSFPFSRSDSLSSKLEELSKTLFPLCSLPATHVPETRSPPRVGEKCL